jgi:hypothetical protein
MNESVFQHIYPHLFTVYVDIFMGFVALFAQAQEGA